MNYTEIKDMVLSFTDRESHTDIIDRFDNILRMVESKINRRLKQEGLTNRAYINTTGDEYYALPVDYNGRIDIQSRDTLESTDRQTLIFRVPEKMNDYANVADSSDLIYYTIVNNQLRVWPKQTSTIIELTYHIKVPELTSGAPNNDISDNAPDCYIFGAMSLVNYFVKDYEASDHCEAKFNNIIEEALLNDFKLIYNGAPLQVIAEDNI